MTTRTCRTCRFWSMATNEPNVLGECHRWPPAHGQDPDVIEEVRPTNVARFPRTHCEDWCGEWRAGRERRTT